MSSFTARLHLPGQAKLPVSVEVDVSDERITLMAENREIASWPLETLDVAVELDGFHLRADDEEFVLITDDSVRFAAALGITGPEHKGSTSSDATRSLTPSRVSELRHEEFKQRISEIADALTSEAVPPDEVFARWLRLLKELNRRHGQGSLPTRLFYPLNTELLDLMPEPTPTTGQ